MDKTWLRRLAPLVLSTLAACGGGDQKPAGAAQAPPPPPQPAAVKAGAEAIAQKKCPISGADIDPNVFTDYQGRRVYFCCPGCISTFQKDPETHLKKIDAQIASK